MGPSLKSSNRGFSLIELLISMIVGLIVIGAAVQLYSSAMDASWVIQQRTEMQQDLRAAENLLLKDISLAGQGFYGVNAESIPLPTSNGNPLYGCTTASPCAPPYTYPCVGVGCVPTLYPIMPGYQKGITPPGGAVKSDVITIVYSDTNLALWCYKFTYANGGNTITLNAPANPPACSLPAGQTYPLAPNNPYTGLVPGDIVMVSNASGGAGIGEVTGVSPANPANTAPTPCTDAPCDNGSSYTITLQNGDPLNLNQSGAANDLTSLTSPTSIQRIFVITYYLGNWKDAGGNTTTILYRQVNGLTAVPMVDNIANMQFTYDTYDTNGNLLNATGDGGEAGGTSPNLIRKVNIAHLTMHSQLYGAKGGYMNKGYQSFDVQTSISARNLSYTNRY
ncbi:MAG TPA: prepilin-type N-terminal cleavage/methylation domain-containing protein [Terriglobales bacterium]|nr:prepilin-type N-terminal cleavage/methylation domain-containing protein [Terriglobales bacterium]